MVFNIVRCPSEAWVLGVSIMGAEVDWRYSFFLLLFVLGPLSLSQLHMIFLVFLSFVYLFITKVGVHLWEQLRKKIFCVHICAGAIILRV